MTKIPVNHCIYILKRFGHQKGIHVTNKKGIKNIKSDRSFFRDTANYRSRISVSFRKKSQATVTCLSKSTSL